MGLLAGFRVLDLATEKGTYTGRLLADLGADVIKVEPPCGDDTRRYPPFAGDAPHPEKSLFFLFYNLNKRSVTLNLEHLQGRAIFGELVSKADAVLESFEPGYMAGLELDYPRLKQVNPAIVFASVSDFGETGPYSNLKSSDLINMAMSGHMQMCGEPGKRPYRLGMQHSYMAASLYAAIGVTAALWFRQSSGTGQSIDVSAQEAAAILIADAAQATNWLALKKNPARTGLRSEAFFPGGAFPVKDGWVAITVWNAPEWDLFAQWAYEVTGNKEWLDPIYKGTGHVRYPYVDYLSEMLLKDFFPKFTKKEFFLEAGQRGIVGFPVQTVQDVVEDEHFKERGFFVDLEHPVVGKVRYPKMPFYMEGIPWQCYRPAPLLGQDNEAIYCEELGYSRQDLVILRATGII